MKSHSVESLLVCVFALHFRLIITQNLISTFHGLSSKWPHNFTATGLGDSVKWPLG